MSRSARRHGSAPPVSSPLPPLYSAWVADALGSLPAPEQTATCANCAMLPPVGDGVPDSDRSSLFFDPRSKCCTYIPELPNFLVGRILLDRTPDAAAGRASVVARIQAGLQVTPLGLDRPPAFAVLYRHSGPDLFGRAVDLRCPHFLPDTGGCGIWRHRMSTCATWFCKYDRGSVGRTAWDAVRQMLRVIERAVAVHCVRTLAPGSTALRRAAADAPTREPRVNAADLGGRPDAAGQRQLWGTCAGRELAFYEACGRMAGALTWPDVLQLGGAELALAVDVAREALAGASSRKVPKVVRLGSFTIGASTPEAVECIAYSPFDPLSIPRDLFEHLHVFDGRTTRNALLALSAAGLEVSPRAVRKLLDHGILVTTDAT